MASYAAEDGERGDGHGGTSDVVLQITNRSTNSLTGVASRRFESRHSSTMASRTSFGKRRARFLRNFSSSKGMPSWRRRRWPSGYPTGSVIHGASLLVRVGAVILRSAYLVRHCFIAVGPRYNPSLRSLTSGGLRGRAMFSYCV